MRYFNFLPGKDGFPWLVGVAAFAIAFVIAYSSIFPSSSAPEAAPAAVAATPAPLPPPVFVTISGPTPVRTEPIVAFSSRIAPVEIVPPAVTASPSAQVIPEGPAAAPAPRNSARCAHVVYRMPAIKRESIFDDVEAKYEAARAVANRRFAAHERCLRDIAPNKG